MPIDVSKIPGRIKEAVKTGNLVPFVGAGLSRQAVTPDPKAFPTWVELLKELAGIAEDQDRVTALERAEIDQLIDKGNFLMAAQAIKSALPADLLENVVQERFAPKVAHPGAVHHALFKLRAPLVVTTNYDLLLEDAYAIEFKKAPQTLTFKDAPLMQRFLQSHRQWVDRPAIFKIHGSAAAPADTILSELDYRNLLYREPGYRIVLSSIFVMKVVVMLGFSFADPELKLLMESLRESLKYRSQPDYIVLPKGEKTSVERQRWRDDFGLEAIEYEPSPGNPEITAFLEYLASLVPTPVPAA